jgi:hypothetical protein
VFEIQVNHKICQGMCCQRPSLYYPEHSLPNH